MAMAERNSYIRIHALSSFPLGTSQSVLDTCMHVDQGTEGV